jgi:hypothetical protein
MCESTTLSNLFIFNFFHFKKINFSPQ